MHTCTHRRRGDGGVGAGVAGAGILPSPSRRAFVAAYGRAYGRNVHTKCLFGIRQSVDRIATVTTMRYR